MKSPGTSSQLRVFFLLQQAAHRLKKEADRALTEAAGLTTAQSAVLVIVASAGSISQKEIARQLRLNESAMTAMVGRLRKARLISRTQDPNDARTNLISLTPTGRKALDGARHAFAQINAKLDSALGRAGTSEFAQSLNSVIDVFLDDG